MAYSFMRFAEKLQRMIDLRGTNQSQLSRKTGIAQSAISEMTKGKRRAYMDQSLLLAKALGVSLDYLADDAQDEPPNTNVSERERTVWGIIRAIGAERAWEILMAELAVKPGDRVLKPTVMEGDRVVMVDGVRVSEPEQRKGAG